VGPTPRGVSAAVIAEWLRSAFASTAPRFAQSDEPPTRGVLGLWILRALSASPAVSGYGHGPGKQFGSW
jgi:hypothetical protein